MSIIFKGNTNHYLESNCSEMLRQTGKTESALTIHTGKNLHFTEFRTKIH